MTSNEQELSLAPSAFSGLVGVARREITPPVGVNSAVWGAATHAVSAGSHGRMEATVLVIQSYEGRAPLVLVGIDHLEFGDMVSDVTEWARAGLPENMATDEAGVMVACSHTHSSPWFMSFREAGEGGELLGPYMEQVRRSVAEAVGEAARRLEPSTITWGTGHCDLAVNRDLPDPHDSGGRFLVGMNPSRLSDDTVVVGRVTRDLDGEMTCVIVNYACHPTVLGPSNRLVGPDFVGGMRGLVEGATGAPCLFLQGASGELAPAEQYSADVGLADRQGRRLGYSVLAVLEGMLAPRMELVLASVLESGAPLAMWRPREFNPDTTVRAMMITSHFPVRTLQDLPELDDLIESSDEPWAAERLVRQRGMSGAMAGEETRPVPAWLWRLGTSVVVGQPNEAYSDLQVQLRQAFPDLSVVVMNLVNDADVVAYLSPAELAGADIYQVWQSPYGPGSLEQLISDCRSGIERLMGA